MSTAGGWGAIRHIAALGLLAGALGLAGGLRAYALSIELKSAGADRIERQRAFEADRLPLPGTPDTRYLEERLAAEGVKSGSPVFIRIFKAQSEFEIWMEKGGRFVHFATYPICNWSGLLGAKTREGDRQTPEGFYSVTSRQIHRLGRWPRALNIGFPNAYDQAHDRSGSYILVHGGCSTVGCFAMTNPVINEIFGLITAALADGQRQIPVHVFPFRMTQENMARYANAEWGDFWRNLKEGYDSFERTHLAPRITVCEGRYHVADGTAADVAEAADVPARESPREKARRITMANGSHTGCPKPQVEAALGQSASPSTRTGTAAVQVAGPHAASGL